MTMAMTGNGPLTAGDVGLVGRGRLTGGVLLLGAAGSSGRFVAAELVARNLPVRLAGRRAGPLEELARSLGDDGASTEVHAVDLTDPASLADAIADVGVVVSTVGPFARRAEPVIDACLAAGTPYVDIANEWSAVRSLLDRDHQARAAGVALVTGAGFGPAATEILVMRLVAQLGGRVPARVQVAAAAQVTQRGNGVRETFQEALSEGAVTYRDGRAVREPLGTGATVLTLGGAQRRMVPAPVGDLEAARRASGAADVVAYVADPSSPASGIGSWAWVEVVWPDGRIAVAELEAGDGLRATAAIAAETTRRVLAGVAPGAWTAARLLGPDVVTAAIGARVTVDG
jgi:short subunit dehydrogenase-like uncharacterized protein